MIVKLRISTHRLFVESIDIPNVHESALGFQLLNLLDYAIHVFPNNNSICDIYFKIRYHILCFVVIS